MFVCILGSSASRSSAPRSGAIAVTRPPYELLVARMLVALPVAAALVVESLVPLPRDGARILMSGARWDLRSDLVRGLALAPVLFGCLWLGRSPVMRRRWPTAFGWAMRDAHLATDLASCAKWTTVLVAFVAWRRWKAKRGEVESGH